MKPVRRTALQGEAIGDGEAIQGLGKGLDRSRYGGTRKGEPSQVRASQKTEGNQARGDGCGSLRRMPQPRRGGTVRREADAINLKITRGMTTKPIAERTS